MSLFCLFPVTHSWTDWERISDTHFVRRCLTCGSSQIKKDERNPERIKLEEGET